MRLTTKATCFLTSAEEDLQAGTLRSTTVLNYDAVCQTFTFADATICILHSAMSHF